MKYVFTFLVLMLFSGFRGHKEVLLTTDIVYPHGGEPDWTRCKKVLIENEGPLLRVASYSMKWTRTHAGFASDFKSQSDKLPPGFISQRRHLRSGDVIELFDVKVLSEKNDTLLFRDLNKTQLLSWKIR